MFAFTNKITPLIRINEVSNGATEDTCNGRPWLEVNVLQGRGDRNSGPLDFTDVVLTNDQAGGSGNHVSFTFPAVEYREGYSVLCMMGEDPTTSPQFSITQGDTVSMLDPFGHTFSTIVYSHLESMSAGTSYSYNDKTGSSEDTTTPTPGEDNVFTKYAETSNEINADTLAHGDVLQITEVADKGSEGVCDEQDWLELWIDPIASPGGLDLSGFLLLTDDLEGNWTFPAGNQGRYPAGYSFICFMGDDPVAGPTTFTLGSNDVVIIKDTSGAIVATSPQRARWGAYGVVYARVSTDNENFVYTTTPTPGAENKVSQITWLALYL